MAKATNPVIPGMFPDPSVCKVGEEYFLASSSFELTPGIPIHRSTDLVEWNLIGHVISHADRLGWNADVAASGGIFAPTLRHHDGLFSIVFTDQHSGRAILMTTRDPAGTWSDPLALEGPVTIDPDLAWTDDGRLLITSAESLQIEVDPLTGKTIGGPRRLWNGTLQYPEAPHLYHIGGYWYLVIAEGGTERGHCISVARGTDPEGPFEAHPRNPVLSHRSTDSEFQNVGHGDLVQGPDGSWWMVALAVRPFGRPPGFHILGRETVLTPVDWVDDWPVPRPVQKSVDVPWLIEDRAPGPFVFEPELTSNGLDPHLVSLRTRPEGDVVSSDGSIVLRARGKSMRQADVTFLGVRQSHRSCRFEVDLDTSDGLGGIALRLDEDHVLELEVDQASVSSRLTIGPVSVEWSRIDRPTGASTLWIESTRWCEAERWSHGPDRLTAGVASTTLIDVDGQHLSTEAAGGFTGRLIGAFASSGHVRITRLRYEEMVEDDD